MNRTLVDITHSPARSCCKKSTKDDSHFLSKSAFKAPDYEDEHLDDLALLDDLE